MRPKLCFADLVKINADYKLNLDNITLLFIYDMIKDDIINNAKQLKSKLKLNTYTIKSTPTGMSFARLLRYITQR